MSSFWSLAPVLAQLAWCLSTLPAVRTIVAARRSDQHSVLAHGGNVAGAVVMLAYAWFGTGDPGLRVGTMVGALTALALFSMVLRYRSRAPSTQPLDEPDRTGAGAAAAGLTSRLRGNPRP